MPRKKKSSKESQVKSERIIRTPIRVIKREYITQIVEPDFDGDYQGNTQTDREILGISISTNNSYQDTVVPYEVLPDVSYYLLYAEYSTGDSFRNDEGGGFEIIGLYRTREEAEENKRLIESHYEENRGDYQNCTITLKNEIGNEYDLYCPWFGYFEHLNNVSVEEVSIISE